ncbi:bifunctional riboflavin kinase/FAD synthetase [Marinoscillum furvescens]|uniref:Riboflavin biosynthesis protein n=1 Tax=Marinoscillum furvescens DSM 4134 TaxID=1122208 RepID=A0A3D9L5S9_MARFU|nr:bifunctional riboflavin kinase/FAD synthetase [Marinoscillum furvescens]REE01279.1 riboflavin kinase/FMN adenylyltransferase [Marinoscillum furvescens DSM 4134]
MQLIDNLDTFEAPGYAVVTSGTFDGVHVGHQKILRKIAKTARAKGGKSIVLTFWPHPRFVLQKGEGLKLITTFEEKAALIAGSGIDYLVKIPFTKEFSELTSDEFVRKIVVGKLNTKKLVIGYDHRFGKNREGGFEYLKANAGEYGFEVEEISRQDIEDVGVSSTRIREALAAGAIHVANDFLGRPYELSGFVKEGDRIGRSIGFPTANIQVPEAYKLIPADGAYAVQVLLDGRKFQGMLNIGQRPTVSGEERRIEVNIFDFDADIYNKRLTIRFIKLLRKEQKFASIDELKQQLSIDKRQASDILNKLV